MFFLVTNVAINSVPFSVDPRSAQLAAAVVHDLTETRAKLKDQRSKLQEALDADQAGWCTCHGLHLSRCPKVMVKWCLKMSKSKDAIHPNENHSLPLLWHQWYTTMIPWLLGHDIMVFVAMNVKWNTCVHDIHPYWSEIVLCPFHGGSHVMFW